MTNVLGMVPLFVSSIGYVFNLVGDFGTVTNSTTFTFDRTGTYSLNLIA